MHPADSIHIKNTTDIKHQIMKLRSLNADQEELLKHDLKEMYYAFQPATIIKSAMQDLGADSEFKSGAIGGTLGFLSNFIFDKLILPPGSGITKYLLNTGIKKLLSFVITRNKDTILKKLSF